MGVSGLQIHARQPYEGGATFGAAGVYERLDGTIHFAVDPADPANRAIVDLDRAARDEAGLVAFRADFCLVQPADPAHGNRRLLFEVLNRGRKLLPRHFNHAAPEATPSAWIDPGDGFLLRHGWSLAWCGWQWDVPQSDALLGLVAPEALEPLPGVPGERRPIQGQVLCRFQPNERGHAHLLADRVHEPYPAADLEDPDAVLTEAAWPQGEPTVIPRDCWRFARDEGGQPTPTATHIWLDSGFVPGRVYEVRYRTSRCPVVGAGLLAVRDTVAYLRYGDVAAGNPCAGRLDWTYGFGMSQSGRFLRHFLYLGLNRDEAGRQVFDGVMPHVAGARRGEFNQRYGQPSVQNTPSFGHLPPFTDDEQTDPRTGRSDGLLRRQRELGGVPKIVTTNSSAEYWRGDCSLIHTDIAGQRDVEPPAEDRVYHFGGTQHGPGTLPLGNLNGNDGSRGAHPFNAVDYVPLLRAALVNLDQWVTGGVEPPPSAFPRLADGSAVPGPVALAAYQALPGATVPDPALLPVIRQLDLGPDADRGIGRYPAAAGAVYPALVSAVDRDGNEVAGVRMPDVTVPVATYAGWNPRHPATGGAGQIIPMQGSTLPFAATAAERTRTGDPRPAIAERYRDRDDYLAQVRAAAEHLVAGRYLLAEDVDLAVCLAAERYDAFTNAECGVRNRSGMRRGGERGTRSAE